MGNAVDEAVRERIQHGGELAEILLENRSEVVEMLLTEYDEEAFVSAMREEGRREGIQEERKEGLKSLIVMMREYVSSPQELYRKIISNKNYKDFTFEEVQRIVESVEKSAAGESR